MPHSHDHDSCTPDLQRDLAVTGMQAPQDASAAAPGGAAPAPEPSSTVAPVVTVSPATLDSEVVARSHQVPVVVLLGSPVDPTLTPLRRDLESRATSAGLQWILAVLDVDRFPQVAERFRPTTLPTVVVVAGGAGVAAWTPADGAQVDCGDWVDQVTATVAGRLDGLPEDTVVTGSGTTDSGTGSSTLITDRRLQEAAEKVGAGNPEAAVDLYDRMLADHTGADEVAVLRRARAAVAVLARTKNLGRADVLTAVAEARRGPQQDAATVLRGADVLVLADRPAEAVELLSASLSLVDASDRENVRLRILEQLHLLDPGDPAVACARQRIADVVF